MDGDTERKADCYCWGILGHKEPGHCRQLPQENDNAFPFRRKGVTLLQQAISCHLDNQ